MTVHIVQRWKLLINQTACTVRALANVGGQASLWNVPSSSSCFSGREVQLAAVKEELHHRRAAPPVGLGGMGKTQTPLTLLRTHP